MTVRRTFLRVNITTPDLSWAGRPSRTLYWTGTRGDDLDTLMSATVSTSLRLGGNGFSLQFAPRNFERESVADLVPSNSLVFIYMGSSAYDEDPTVLVGLTSEPVEDEVFTAAGPQRVITISGRGLDGVLAEAGIYRNTALNALGPAALKLLSEDLARLSNPATDADLTEGTIASWMGMMWLAGIDPREAIARVIYYFVSDEAKTVINLRLPGMASLGDVLTVGGQTPRDPAVAEWVRKFSAAVEEAKRSGKNMVPKMKDAAKFKCPIPESWTLLQSDLALPVASINPAAGSILDIIQGATDPLFHEVYAIHRDDRVDIMFGAKPFISPEEIEGTGMYGDSAAKAGQITVDLSPLIDVGLSLGGPTSGFGGTQFSSGSDVKTIEITTGDMVGRQSLRRGLPVANLWHVLPGAGSTMDSEAMKNMVMPSISGRANFSDFMRFGLKPREQGMPYLPGDYLGITADVAKTAKERAEGLTNLISKMNRTLKAWEDPHPFMWSGTLTVNGRAAFKPGTRLLWRGEDVNKRPDGRPLREFYIEGAHHTYQCANGTYNTALQVTRGWELRGQ